MDGDPGDEQVRPGANMPRVLPATAVLGMTPFDVWIAYFAVGGNADRATVESWWSGDGVPGQRDDDLLAAAVNDALRDHGLDPDIPRSGRGDET